MKKKTPGQMEEYSLRHDVDEKGGNSSSSLSRIGEKCVCVCSRLRRWLFSFSIGQANEKKEALCVLFQIARRFNSLSLSLVSPTSLSCVYIAEWIGTRGFSVTWSLPAERTCCRSSLSVYHHFSRLPLFVLEGFVTDIFEKK